MTMKPSTSALGTAGMASPSNDANEGVQRVSKAQILEDRARKLSIRFGLQIQPFGWRMADPDETVLRTDKPICMRVRWTCHRCSSSFASLTTCPNCDHARCTKCFRFPPARLVADKKDSAYTPDGGESLAIPDYNWLDAGILLTKPSKTGGQDLIHKKPRQRVRRFCHECRTPFILTSKTCVTCSHIRCTDCPREPANKAKYPFGYPGDEFGPNSIPYYECDRCLTLFPPGAEDGTACSRCGREKSLNCRRAKPRAVERHDPDVLKTILAKLDALKLQEGGDGQSYDDRDSSRQ